MEDRPPDNAAELLAKLRLDRAPARVRARRRRPWALIIAAVVVVAAAVWLARARADVPVVQTAVARVPAAGGAEASVLDASGYVTARRQATVSAKITGKVTEVLIEEGMRVEEGAVLARLDDTEARAQLALANAQLVAAKSALAEVQAQLAQAERDFVRQQSLAREQLTPLQSLDAARAQRDMLRARLVNTNEQAKVAAESVAVAHVQLDNTEVRAPFAGIVVAKAAQPGEMISPISAGGGFTRTGIGTIVDMDSLEFEVDVNEAFINRVTAGQPVEATLNAYPEWKIPAEVIAVIPTADRSKATVKVRIAIKQKDPRIVPDMGVRVAFLNPKTAQTAPKSDDASATGAAPEGVLVPATAVRTEGDAGVVFVVSDGKVERRKVTLGRVAGADHHVLRGLAGGERVVVSPPESLRDGDAVRLAESG